MTLGRQLLAAGAQLLLVVLIARGLGPEGNGHYAMAILVPSLLVTFFSLGVGPATVYHVGRKQFSARQALSENTRLGLLIALTGMFIALPLILTWHENLFPDVPKGILLIGLAAFPISLLVGYFNTILQGLEDFRSFNVAMLLPPYVTLVGAAVNLFVLKGSVQGTVIAYLIGQTVGLALALLLVLRRTKGQRSEARIMTRQDYHKATIGYGWKAHLSNVLAFVNYRADIFLVNFFLNPSSTGVYVVAVQIAEKLWMLSKAASAVLLPRLSAMYEDPYARLRLTQKGFFIVSGLTCVASLVMAVALYWLLEPIFGAAYKDALPAFIWLLPGIVAGAGARIQANAVASAGKPVWNMYAAVVVISINIGGNILFIPSYGIIGAAWATSISYIINAFVKYFMVRKTLTLDY